VQGGADVTSLAGGVLIYLTNDGAGGTTYSKFKVQSSSATLSPMSTGKYSGITIFQDRNATLDNAMTISGGSGSINIKGMIYAPRADLAVTGGASVTAGDSYIVDKLTISGSSGFSLPNPQIPVRATRKFGLVE
jgi:hypothetical protein